MAMNIMNETKRNSLQVVRTNAAAVAMILTQLLLLLLLQFKTTESAKNTVALPGCQESCGDIPIPYPFGIAQNCDVSNNTITCKTLDGPNCFMEGFDVSCYTFEADNSSFPFLTNSRSEILNISLSLGQVRIVSPLSEQCYNSTTKKEEYTSTNSWDFINIAPFRLNTEKNKFTVTGCNTLAYLNLPDNHFNYSVGCLSSCNSLDTLINNGSCSGIGCCQTAIPKETNSILANFDERYNNSGVYNFSRCSYAMVVEEAEFQFDTTYITTDRLSSSSTKFPMVLDWAIGNTTCDTAQENKSSFACISDHSNCFTVNGGGYLCNCSDGYEGNPYLHGGCQDIDECANTNPCSKPGKCDNNIGGYRCSCPFGLRNDHKDSTECVLNGILLVGIPAGIVALLFLGIGIYVVLERRNLSTAKEKYFQQHGGWILLDIKSNKGFGFTIFTKQQVEQATKNFDSSNILGHGGHGTVYRGTLRDQTVAIKKCKIVDESKKKEFGKEMLILSQINHKNIVKILGCCLEVEVPMLVYEFIPNGTLYHYIHHKKQGSHISLTTRLRVAHESAEALAYLHTAASPPIFHGDVKSANILLDQNYSAKVSDFGASILAPTDEAQFVTLVQGTCGYLDPEYMQSCKLTDKSDVYSFGVVLLELLTSKPVIDFVAPEEARSLSSLFLSAMEENKMQEILDAEIIREDDMELIMAVAKLAKECLSMKGEQRPMMNEVAEELHRISKLKRYPWGQEYCPEETETLFSEQFHNNTEIEHASYYFHVDKEAEESIAFGR